MEPIIKEAKQIEKDSDKIIKYISDKKDSIDEKLSSLTSKGLDIKLDEDPFAKELSEVFYERKVGPIIDQIINNVEKTYDSIREDLESLRDSIQGVLNKYLRKIEALEKIKKKIEEFKKKYENIPRFYSLQPHLEALELGKEFGDQIKKVLETIENILERTNQYKEKDMISLIDKFIQYENALLNNIYKTIIAKNRETLKDLSETYIENIKSFQNEIVQDLNKRRKNIENIRDKNKDLIDMYSTAASEIAASYLSQDQIEWKDEVVDLLKRFLDSKEK